MSDDRFSANRIKQHGSFYLDTAPAGAFKLFTAAGERLWVPGWKPHILGPLPQQAGLVFTTGVGAEHTIWTVIESDAAIFCVRYSRVTPASRAGIVTVQVTADRGGSLVRVSYDLIALTSEGAASLDAYSPDKFAEMMTAWQQLIFAKLAEASINLASLVV